MRKHFIKFYYSLTTSYMLKRCRWGTWNINILPHDWKWSEHEPKAHSFTLNPLLENGKKCLCMQVVNHSSASLSLFLSRDAWGLICASSLWLITRGLWMLHCHERKWKMQLPVWDGWENRTRRRLTVTIGNSEIKWHEIKQRTLRKQGQIIEVQSRLYSLR